MKMEHPVTKMAREIEANCDARELEALIARFQAAVARKRRNPRRATTSVRAAKPGQCERMMARGEGQTAGRCAAKATRKFATPAGNTKRMCAQCERELRNQ